MTEILIDTNVLISFMQKNNIKYIISFDEDFDKIDGIERIYNSKKKLS